MIARDVVLGAALLAARHAWPELPESLVRWSDDAQSQGEGDDPRLTLSTVSLVPEGPVSIRRSLNPQGELDQRLLQTYIWTVQFKCEGWKLDSGEHNNPILFAHRTRFGWYLQAVEDSLLDRGSPASERTPVKVVDQAGQILTLNQNVRGHTLPVHVYEIEFRYVDRDADPLPVGVIETAALEGTLEGTLEGGDATITAPTES